MSGINLYKKVLVKKKWPGLVYLFLGLVIITWLITVSIAPYYKIREIQGLVNADPVFTEEPDSIDYHPELVNLVRERAYKKALLKLSENE